MSTDSEVSERKELLEALRDKGRRHHLASVVTTRGLAEQIREIRQARGWTQSELASATDKVQETISKLENPNYGNYTIKTLQRLAEAFDVKLTVRFDPFSELVRWMTQLSPEDLAVPDYDHDPGLQPALGVDLTVHRNGHDDPGAFPNVIKFPNTPPGVPITNVDQKVRLGKIISFSSYRTPTWCINSEPASLLVVR